MEYSTFYLVALAVFGIGFAVNHFAPNSTLATLVAIAAGVMGVLAIVALL